MTIASSMFVAIPDSMQIIRTAVKLCGNMAELDKRLSVVPASPIQGHTLMQVVKPDAQFLIAFDDGAILGEVNASLEQVLNDIVEQQYLLHFEVFAPVRAIRETISRATKEKDAVVRVQINIYGPRKIAHEIGRELSKAKLYLQRPDYVREGIDYDNPHMLKLEGDQDQLPVTSINEQEIVAEKTTDDIMKETIADVFSSLTRDKNLQGLEGDERLKTRLLE
jgi:SWI/SNF-related matrix-associated actin-dependent regulator of chromatin subfamily A3